MGANRAGLRGQAALHPANAPIAVALAVFYEREGLAGGLDVLATLVAETPE
jgi:hypothetical protein